MSSPTKTTCGETNVLEGTPPIPSTSSSKNKGEGKKSTKSTEASDRKRSAHSASSSSSSPEINLGETQMNSLLAQLKDIVKDTVASMMPSQSGPPNEEPLTKKVRAVEEEANFGELYADSSDDSDDECVDYLSSFFTKTEDEGQPIRENLAKTINSALRDREIDTERIKGLLSKYKRPQNIPNLRPPDLNQEFMGEPSVRIPDARMGVIQNLVGQGLSAALYLAQDLLEARERKTPVDAKSTYFKVLDLVTLLTTTFTTATRKRQEACKYLFAPKYKKVCTEATVSSTLLFGDDFQKLLKESSESKLSPFDTKDPKNVRFPVTWRGRGKFYPHQPRHQYNRAQRKGPYHQSQTRRRQSGSFAHRKNERKEAKTQ